MIECKSQFASHLAALGDKPVSAQAYHVLPVELLQANAAVVELVESPQLKLINSYYQAGLPGTRAQMFTRQSLAMRLARICEQLAPDYGLWVFDAYRSRATQQAIFDVMYQDVAKQYPEASAAQILDRALQFVSHPTDTSRFAIPLHVSGGAIDVAIFSTATQEPLDFGAAFDECSNRSAMDYYEAPHDATSRYSESEWQAIRRNRRILFHLFIAQGFFNFSSEWWHFDLGDCHYANTANYAWFYPEIQLSTLQEA